MKGEQRTVSLQFVALIPKHPEKRLRNRGGTMENLTRSIPLVCQISKPQPWDAMNKQNCQGRGRIPRAVRRGTQPGGLKTNDTEASSIEKKRKKSAEGELFTRVHQKGSLGENMGDTWN